MTSADASWFLLAAMVGLPALVYGIVLARAVYEWMTEWRQTRQLMGLVELESWWRLPSRER